MTNRNDDYWPDEGIQSLLGAIRSARPGSGNANHRHFSNVDRQPRNAGYGQSDCVCGARKFPSAPRCPRCAHEAGYIDERTMAKLLAELSGEMPANRRGSTKCSCGRAKLPETNHCKPCAVALGILEVNVQPGEEPCPDCGDGKKPVFACCAPCAMSKEYIDRAYRVTANCPTDDCECGNAKYAAYAKCAQCVRGITGFRHDDWTTGPNPVRIFDPMPTRKPPENMTARRANPPIQAASTEPDARPDNLPCLRCDKPTPAGKRFCMDCIIGMGAPPSEYDGDFNDRSRG